MSYDPYKPFRMVACPDCNAQPGEFCSMRAGFALPTTTYHQSRVTLAEANEALVEMGDSQEIPINPWETTLR
jgi:hypothetical protein